MNSNQQNFFKKKTRITRLIARNRAGFTLTEVIVVVVLLSIMAGFALPNYANSIQRNHERDAVVQLTTIHAANAMYFASEQQYSPDIAGTDNRAQINTDLSINIVANDKTYDYNRTATNAYTTTVSWTSGGNNYTLRINQTPVTSVTIANPNPCCQTDNCVWVSDCP